MTLTSGGQTQTGQGGGMQNGQGDGTQGGVRSRQRSGGQQSPSIDSNGVIRRGGQPPR